MLKYIRIYYSFLSFISPKLAAKSAFITFQKVRKKDIRDREKNFFSKGLITKVIFDPENLTQIEYGQQYNDVILLVHGWDSNAGCMSAIVSELLKTKHHIISFNLPGHADYKNSHTNLKECELAFQTILQNIPDTKKLSIISHSFGSAVTAYALSKTTRKIDKLIFLTSPNKIIDLFSDFKTLISLRNKAYQLFLKKAQSVIKQKIENIEISKILEECNFNELIIFHDKHDKIIPFSNSAKIHSVISNSKLFQYESIGHYRMLWNKKLVEDIKNIF